MSGDGTTRTHTLREFNFRGVAQTHTVRDESRRFNGNQQVGKCPSPSQEENWVGMVGGSPPKADLALILPTPSGLSSRGGQAVRGPSAGVRTPCFGRLAPVREPWRSFTGPASFWLRG